MGGYGCYSAILIYSFKSSSLIKQPCILVSTHSLDRSISPLPKRCPALGESRIIWEFELVLVLNAIFAGRLAFMTQVTISLSGLCVDRIRCIHDALAFQLSFIIEDSILSFELLLLRIKSANSSNIITIWGILIVVI